MIVKNNKDCYDYTQFGENSELVYESVICGKNIYNVIGSSRVLDGKDIAYSFFCYSNNSNLFGCVGLKSNRYCILNKQYSKEEYEKLLPQIIEHINAMPYVDKKRRTYVYGDFLPAEISQFDYNETSAQEFFPLTKEDFINLPQFHFYIKLMLEGKTSRAFSGVSENPQYPVFKDNPEQARLINQLAYALPRQLVEAQLDGIQAS